MNLPREIEPLHDSDSDCLVTRSDRCIECGRLHRNRCSECGQRAFHLAGCSRISEVYDPATQDARILGIVQRGNFRYPAIVGEQIRPNDVIVFEDGRIGRILSVAPFGSWLKDRRARFDVLFQPLMRRVRSHKGVELVEVDEPRRFIAKNRQVFGLRI